MKLRPLLRFLLLVPSILTAIPFEPNDPYFDDALYTHEGETKLFQGQTDGMGNPDPYVNPTWSTVPVRVKNHSYGPNRGFGLHDNYQLIINALEESASHGVLHVWSAGNQRMSGPDPWDPWPTGDTNKIFTSNLPQNIIVAALGSDGNFSDYSSHGASIFVTAPSSGIDGFGLIDAGAFTEAATLVDTLTEQTEYETPEIDWKDRRDYYDEDLEWLFLSNAYWGEDPDGDWTLELFNGTANPLSGTWLDYTFTAAMGELSFVPEPSSFAFLLALAMVPTLFRRRPRGST